MPPPPKTAPSIFRILLPVKNLDQARTFYQSLLGVRSRTVARGRVYLDCGPVILGLLDYAGVDGGGSPPTEAVYFSTPEIERVHRRAKKLGCLATGLLHGDPKSPLGEVVVRPWGERAFYVEDPSGNPLCFVDARTKFTGTRSQVTALRRAFH
jgi:catechol 2,3-dioxygenase-like lactoylglutathione lyase family enzyme